jgi:hypothetical protein
MASGPCFLDQLRIVELEKRGKLYIAPNTSLIKRSALIEAGKFIPELKWHSDWFGFYVAGFRYGICFVPEPLAIFYVHATSYYSTGTRNKLVHRGVLERMLALLNSKDYQDVTELIRESGALYLFGRPMLRLLLSRPEYRRFITPVFLRKNLLRIVQLELKKVTPTFIGNCYLRMTGKRMRVSEIQT